MSDYSTSRRASKGPFVFTARDKKAAFDLGSDAVEVLEMDEDMATQLLKEYLLDKNPCQETSRIQHHLLEQLTYLPTLLSYKQWAYIEKNGITLS